MTSLGFSFLHWAAVSLLQRLAYLCERTSGKKHCLFVFTVTGHDLKFETAQLGIFKPPASSVDLQQRIVELEREGLIVREITTEMGVPAGGTHKTPCT